jgi:hypothetical protein
MKTKLIKREDNFYSLKVDGIVMATSNGMLVDYKLSKQNCDEIFGVVDVEKLAEECAETAHTMDELYENGLFYGFMSGFNKHAELNKDKVFTEFDIISAFEYGWNQRHFDKTDEDELREIQKRFIQSIQQPTEIDVEIVMRNSRTGNIVKHDSDLEWDEDGLCDRAIPKLDSNGCLILKPIV